MQGGVLENLEKNELDYDVERTGDEDLRELTTGLLGLAERANEPTKASLKHLVQNIRRVLTNA